MSTEYLIPRDITERYHVREWRNATGILTTACGEEWKEMLAVLRGFKLLRSEIVVGGGNRSLISRRIDGAFYKLGWTEKAFATAITIDEQTFDSPTHAVDCFKKGVALEVGAPFSHSLSKRTFMWTMAMPPLTRLKAGLQSPRLPKPKARLPFPQETRTWLN